MPFSRQFYALSEPVNRRLARLPRWLYLILITFITLAIVFLSQLVGGAVLALTFGPEILTGGGLPSTPVALTALLVAAFLPIFFFSWAALRLLERRGLASVGMRLANAGGYYLRGVVVGLLMIGGAVGLMSLLGYTAVENPFRGASIAGAFLVLIGWVVQGAAEEVAVRGFLFQIFGRLSGTLAAILVSSVVFVLLHGGNPNTSPIAFLNLLLFSIFAAFYTLYEGGLWGIFAIHSVWNWAQGNLFGFEVSGNAIESAVVLDLMETGPDTLTGGLFGPEGGLLVTLVLLVSMVAVWIAAQREPAQPDTLVASTS